MASEKIINQKKEEVSKLAAKMKDASIILLTDYRGINVADVTNLRAKLRKANSEYCVIKNNITRRALENCGIKELDSVLEGPTAVIMTTMARLTYISFLMFMTHFLFCFGECIYERHVERRRQHRVEHLFHPWIVLHLDFSVWSVGCLGIFLVFRMNKACRCGILHLPSLGDVVRITYHR